MTTEHDSIHDPIQWHCTWQVDKYIGDDTTQDPYETINGEGNLLMIGGASIIWEIFIAASGTAFDNANAYLGVGDSAIAALDTQTDLQAASNKVRKPMEVSFPSHTDSVSDTAAKTVTFKSSFGTSDANFAWQEWALFNASSSGRMLNRKVVSLGTKTSANTWTLTITISIG